jgi:hypothetical protein
MKSGQLWGSFHGLLGTFFLFTHLRTMERQLSNRLVKLIARHALSRKYLLMTNAFTDWTKREYGPLRNLLSNRT